MGRKLLILFCCAVCGAMLGLWVSKMKKAKLDYYNALVMLVNKLSIEIGFSKKTIKDILTDFSLSDKTYLKDHINNYIEYISSTLEKKELIFKKIFYKEENLGLIKDFFMQLGTLDSYSQIKSIDGYKIKFQEIYDNLFKKEKKYGSMYIKLGFLLGVAVGIFFL